MLDDLRQDLKQPGTNVSIQSSPFKQESGSIPYTRINKLVQMKLVVLETLVNACIESSYKMYLWNVHTVGSREGTIFPVQKRHLDEEKGESKPH